MSELQKQGLLRINYGQEHGKNGEYGSRYPYGDRSDREDIVKYGRLLETPNRQGDIPNYHSSFGSDRHHDSHRYHPYRRSDKGYMSNEFKKEKTPTFDGEMKKP